MQLTFGNITMEVNIFNLVKKPKSYEDDPLDVFIIDNVVEEHVDDFMRYNLDTYYEHSELALVYQSMDLYGLVSSLRITSLK